MLFCSALLFAASVLGDGSSAPELLERVEPAEDCAPPEPGFLTLDTVPWTQVYVDGVYAGSTPLYKHKLPPGEHTLTLVNEGRALQSEEVVVIDEGRLRKLRLILAVEESSAALDNSGDVSTDPLDCLVPEDLAAAITVDTQPWSQVFIDGKLAGSTPLFKQLVPAGPHVVRMVRADGRSSFARLHANVGETVKLSFALTD